VHSGSPVDLPVAYALTKLIRLSERLSCMVVSPVESPVMSPAVAIHELGTSDANNHMRKAGYFHAAGEFIRLSARLSLHFASPVTHFVAPVAPPVVSTVTP